MQRYVNEFIKDLTRKEKVLYKLLNKQKYVDFHWTNGYVFEFFYKECFVTLADQGDRFCVEFKPLWECSDPTDTTIIDEEFDIRHGSGIDYADDPYCFLIYSHDRKIMIEKLFIRIEKLLVAKDAKDLELLKLDNVEVAEHFKTTHKTSGFIDRFINRDIYVKG